MNPIKQRGLSLGLLRTTLLLLAFGTWGGALAQKQAAKPAEAQPRLILAINEGGAANADATETDVPAEAIRDFGYQAIAMAKEPSQTLFIVPKTSRLKSIADVKGKTIVTPDQYSNMWRVANAMLRDSNIIMANEQVKAMRDQAAIGWSMENSFYDVGVINSVSGVARSWEKNGGRVLARSRELPNMPFIASPEVTEEQVAKLRVAVIALDTTDSGKAVLKKIGLTGFQAANSKVFLDFLAWIGDLEVAKNADQP